MMIRIRLYRAVQLTPRAAITACVVLASALCLAEGERSTIHTLTLSPISDIELSQQKVKPPNEAFELGSPDIPFDSDLPSNRVPAFNSQIVHPVTPGGGRSLWGEMGDIPASVPSIPPFTPSARPHWLPPAPGQ